jgi:hypothetical protein
MSLEYSTIRETMTPRRWFEVGVRLMGVWQIVSGLDESVSYFNFVAKLFTSNTTTPNVYLSHAIGHLLVGFFLLFAAVSIANTVYPPSPVITEEHQ